METTNYVGGGQESEGATFSLNIDTPKCKDCPSTVNLEDITEDNSAVDLKDTTESSTPPCTLPPLIDKEVNKLIDAAMSLESTDATTPMTVGKESSNANMGQSPSTVEPDSTTGTSGTSNERPVTCSLGDHDMYLCGNCNKIFNHLDVFLAHKRVTLNAQVQPSAVAMPQVIYQLPAPPVLGIDPNLISAFGGAAAAQKFILPKGYSVMTPKLHEPAPLVKKCAKRRSSIAPNPKGRKTKKDSSLASPISGPPMTPTVSHPTDILEAALRDALPELDSPGLSNQNDILDDLDFLLSDLAGTTEDSVKQIKPKRRKKLPKSSSGKGVCCLSDTETIDYKYLSTSNRKRRNSDSNLLIKKQEPRNHKTVPRVHPSSFAVAIDQLKDAQTALAKVIQPIAANKKPETKKPKRDSVKISKEAERTANKIGKDVKQSLKKTSHTGAPMKRNQSTETPVNNSSNQLSTSASDSNLRTCRGTLIDYTPNLLSNSQFTLPSSFTSMNARNPLITEPEIRQLPIIKSKSKRPRQVNESKGPGNANSPADKVSIEDNALKPKLPARDLLCLQNNDVCDATENKDADESAVKEAIVIEEAVLIVKKRKRRTKQEIDDDRQKLKNEMVESENCLVIESVEQSIVTPKVGEADEAKSASEFLVIAEKGTDPEMEDILNDLVIDHRPREEETEDDSSAVAERLVGEEAGDCMTGNARKSYPQRKCRDPCLDRLLLSDNKTQPVDHDPEATVADDCTKKAPDGDQGSLVEVKVKRGRGRPRLKKPDATLVEVGKKNASLEVDRCAAEVKTIKVVRKRGRPKIIRIAADVEVKVVKETSGRRIMKRNSKFNSDNEDDESLRLAIENSLKDFRTGKASGAVVNPATKAGHNQSVKRNECKASSDTDLKVKKARDLELPRNGATSGDTDMSTNCKLDVDRLAANAANPNVTVPRRSRGRPKSSGVIRGKSDTGDVNAECRSLSGDTLANQKRRVRELSIDSDMHPLITRALSNKTTGSTEFVIDSQSSSEEKVGKLSKILRKTIVVGVNEERDAEYSALTLDSSSGVTLEAVKSDIDAGETSIAEDGNASQTKDFEGNVEMAVGVVESAEPDNLGVVNSGRSSLGHLNVTTAAKRTANDKGNDETNITETPQIIVENINRKEAQLSNSPELIRPPAENKGRSEKSAESVKTGKNDVTKDCLSPSLNVKVTELVVKTQANHRRESCSDKRMRNENVNFQHEDSPHLSLLEMSASTTEPNKNSRKVSTSPDTQNQNVPHVHHGLCMEPDVANATEAGSDASTMIEIDSNSLEIDVYDGLIKRTESSITNFEKGRNSNPVVKAAALQDKNGGYSCSDDRAANRNDVSVVNGSVLKSAANIPTIPATKTLRKSRRDSSSNDRAANHIDVTEEHRSVLKSATNNPTILAGKTLRKSRRDSTSNDRAANHIDVTEEHRSVLKSATNNPSIPASKTLRKNRRDSSSNDRAANHIDVTEEHRSVLKSATNNPTIPASKTLRKSRRDSSSNDRAANHIDVTEEHRSVLKSATNNPTIPASKTLRNTRRNSTSDEKAATHNDLTEEHGSVLKSAANNPTKPATKTLRKSRRDSSSYETEFRRGVIAESYATLIPNKTNVTVSQSKPPKHRNKLVEYAETRKIDSVDVHQDITDRIYQGVIDSSPRVRRSSRRISSSDEVQEPQNTNVAHIRALHLDALEAADRSSKTPANTRKHSASHSAPGVSGDPALRQIGGGELGDRFYPGRPRTRSSTRVVCSRNPDPKKLSESGCTKGLRPGNRDPPCRSKQMMLSQNKTSAKLRSKLVVDANELKKELEYQHQVLIGRHSDKDDDQILISDLQSAAPIIRFEASKNNQETEGKLSCNGSLNIATKISDKGVAKCTGQQEEIRTVGRHSDISNMVDNTKTVGILAEQTHKLSLMTTHDASDIQKSECRGIMADVLDNRVCDVVKSTHVRREIEDFLDSCIRETEKRRKLKYRWASRFDDSIIHTDTTESVNADPMGGTEINAKIMNIGKSDSSSNVFCQRSFTPDNLSMVQCIDQCVNYAGQSHRISGASMQNDCFDCETEKLNISKEIRVAGINICKAETDVGVESMETRVDGGNVDDLPVSLSGTILLESRDGNDCCLTKNGAMKRCRLNKGGNRDDGSHLERSDDKLCQVVTDTVVVQDSMNCIDVQNLKLSPRKIQVCKSLNNQYACQTGKANMIGCAGGHSPAGTHGAVGDLDRDIEAVDDASIEVIDEVIDDVHRNVGNVDGVRIAYEVVDVLNEVPDVVDSVNEDIKNSESCLNDGPIHVVCSNESLPKDKLLNNSETMFLSCSMKAIPGGPAPITSRRSSRLQPQERGRAADRKSKASGKRLDCKVGKLFDDEVKSSKLDVSASIVGSRLHRAVGLDSSDSGVQLKPFENVGKIADRPNQKARHLVSKKRTGKKCGKKAQTRISNSNSKIDFENNLNDVINPPYDVDVTASLIRQSMDEFAALIDNVDIEASIENGFNIWEYFGQFKQWFDTVAATDPIAASDSTAASDPIAASDSTAASDPITASDPKVASDPIAASDTIAASDSIVEASNFGSVLRDRTTITTPNHSLEGKRPSRKGNLTCLKGIECDYPGDDQLAKPELPTIRDIGNGAAKTSKVLRVCPKINCIKTRRTSLTNHVANTSDLEIVQRKSVMSSRVLLPSIDIQTVDPRPLVRRRSKRRGPTTNRRKKEIVPEYLPTKRLRLKIKNIRNDVGIIDVDPSSSEIEKCGLMTKNMPLLSSKSEKRRLMTENVPRGINYASESTKLMYLSKAKDNGSDKARDAMSAGVSTPTERPRRTLKGAKYEIMKEFMKKKHCRVKKCPVACTVPSTIKEDTFESELNHDLEEIKCLRKRQRKQIVDQKNNERVKNGKCSIYSEDDDDDDVPLFKRKTLKQKSNSNERNKDKLSISGTLSSRRRSIANKDKNSVVDEPLLTAESSHSVFIKKQHENLSENVPPHPPADDHIPPVNIEKQQECLPENVPPQPPAECDIQSVKNGKQQENLPENVPPHSPAEGDIQSVVIEKQEENLPENVPPHPPADDHIPPVDIERQQEYLPENFPPQPPADDHIPPVYIEKQQEYLPENFPPQPPADDYIPPVYIEKQQEYLPENFPPQPPPDCDIQSVKNEKQQENLPKNVAPHSPAEGDIEIQQENLPENVAPHPSAIDHILPAVIEIQQENLPKNVPPHSPAEGDTPPVDIEKQQECLPENVPPQPPAECDIQSVKNENEQENLPENFPPQPPVDGDIQSVVSEKQQENLPDNVPPHPLADEDIQSAVIERENEKMPDNVSTPLRGDGDIQSVVVQKTHKAMPDNVSPHRQLDGDIQLVVVQNTPGNFSPHRPLDGDIQPVVVEKGHQNLPDNDAHLFPGDNFSRLNVVDKLHKNRAVYDRSRSPKHDLLLPSIELCSQNVSHDIEHQPLKFRFSRSPSYDVPKTADSTLTLSRLLVPPSDCAPLSSPNGTWSISRSAEGFTAVIKFLDDIIKKAGYLVSPETGSRRKKASLICVNDDDVGGASPELPFEAGSSYRVIERDTKRAGNSDVSSDTHSNKYLRLTGDERVTSCAIDSRILRTNYRKHKPNQETFPDSLCPNKKSRQNIPELRPQDDSPSLGEVSHLHSPCTHTSNHDPVSHTHEIKCKLTESLIESHSDCKTLKDVQILQTKGSKKDRIDRNEDLMVTFNHADDDSNGKFLPSLCDITSKSDRHSVTMNSGLKLKISLIKRYSSDSRSVNPGTFELAACSAGSTLIDPSREILRDSIEGTGRSPSPSIVISELNCKARAGDEEEPLKRRIDHIITYLGKDAESSINVGQERKLTGNLAENGKIPNLHARVGLRECEVRLTRCTGVENGSCQRNPAYDKR